MMKRLTEKEWKPIKIIDIFETIKPGKISQANQFEKVSNGGVNYIAATNRNNGVLYHLEPSEDLKKKVQAGNCIGFIKDGDGSAGYAIYKHEPFASTVNVIYGYADWLNRENGLFFVAAQDMIEDKYSHGYKRNLQHLRGDKVMLPVDDKGNPDYAYMTLYSTEVRGGMLMRYKNLIAGQLSQLEHMDIPALHEKEWGHFLIPDVFPNIQRGKRLKNADHVPGIIPYVSSTAKNNGVDDYVMATAGTRSFSDCISLANSGSVGTAFYEPFEFVASDHVTSLKREGTSKFVYLFLATTIERQGSNFNFNREINDARIKKMQVMLPVTDEGKPDYKYMEQYAKNMMLKKYEQYLAFIDRQSSAEEVNV